MFYENFVALCNARGETPSRAAENAGLSRAAVTGWKQNQDTPPSPAALEKLCNYFQVSVDELLGETAQPTSFYDRYCALCRSRGVSPSRAAEDAGLSKSAVSKWKREQDVSPSGAVLSKLSTYFGIPAWELLGEKSAPNPGDEAIKFALFGGREDITPEMFEEVRSFAQFVLEREDRKKKS